MGQRGVRLYRPLLLAAALDSLLGGLWATAYPAGLFALLRMTPPTDAFLWRVLGGLVLAQAVCLLLAAWRPNEYAGLVLVPLIGRALACGLWLWLLGTDRVLLPAGPLLGLLLHDGVWLPVLAVFLYAVRPSL